MFQKVNTPIIGIIENMVGMHLSGKLTNTDIKKTSLYIDNNLLFLLTFSIPIIVIVFIEAILVRANANWAAPALVCLLIFLNKLHKLCRFLKDANLKLKMHCRHFLLLY